MNHTSSSNKELETETKSNDYTNSVNNQTESKTGLRGVPLSTRNAVKYLLQGTLRLRVCRYCLNVTNDLSELDEVLTLAVNGSLHEVTLRDIVASFYPFKVAGDPNFPNKICNECVNRAINCYLFTQQCERAERSLRNCFEDIYETFEKLDPVVPVKKRGKRKLNPNHNIIYTDHKDVIDYAEPIINIINVTSDSTQNNDDISSLECQKCWQVLPNVESLLNHEKSHPKNMWYNCRLCGKSFVKRTLLKRHIKGTHEYEDDISSEIKAEQFECKECGLFSKTLGEHLQHCETHKFKGLFKSLIERKVDMLCSVCLDKSSRLMDLGEVVHLHGGYSGLTGDKNIRNILTATIPGPNLQKYQELLVPHKAKILKITKRNYESTKNSCLSQELKKQCLNMKVKFASPILVAKMEFELTNFLIFRFAKPYLINPMQDLTKQSCPEYTAVKDKTVINNNELTNDYDTRHRSLKKLCTEINEINFRETLECAKLITVKDSETYLFNQTQWPNIEKLPKHPMNKDRTLVNDIGIGNHSSKDVEQEQVNKNDSLLIKSLIFSFRQPDLNKALETINQRVPKSINNESTIQSTVSIETYDPNQLINTKKDSKLTNYIFTFSKPMLLDFDENVSEPQDSTFSSVKDVTLINENLQNANISESMKETVNSCKNCWIFKNQSCKSCLHPINSNVNIIDKSHSTLIEKGNCKFCWIFDKAGDCGYCKHRVDCCEQIHENIEKVAKIDIDVNKVQCLKKGLTNDANEYKMTWQCTVCLSNNSNNIVSCICCDEKNDRNKYPKFNYGNFTTFYTGINKVKEHPIENKVIDKSDKNIAEYSKINELQVIKEHSIENKTIDKSDKNIAEYSKNINELQVNMEDEPMETLQNSASSHVITPSLDRDITSNNDLLMDVEITPFDNKLHNTSNIETMDIVFENYDRPNPKTIPISDQTYMNTQSNYGDIFQKFNFDIGVRELKHTTDRRFKRALRRIATPRK